MRSAMRHCSTLVVQTVVQFPSSQRADEYCVIFERTSNGAPNYLRLRVVLREFGNQDVKAVNDSAALVMHDVIITPYGCSNNALPGERWVRDGISRVPILARVREPAFVVDTKRENGRWQIPGRMNLLKGRGILQDLGILRSKLRDICVA